jgi:anti-sigma factor RsiW
MSSKRDMELQRYFDGELGARRARAVHLRLQASPEEQEQLAGMEAMRELVREASEAAADEADFDNLWARVRVGIRQEEPVPLGERLGLWVRRYGLVAATAAAAVLLALALLLPARGPSGPVSNNAVVESLELGPEATGTVFTIADSGDTGETTVIWVSETSAEGDAQ